MSKTVPSQLWQFALIGVIAGEESALLCQCTRFLALVWVLLLLLLALALALVLDQVLALELALSVVLTPALALALVPGGWREIWH